MPAPTVIPNATAPNVAPPVSASASARPLPAVLPPPALASSSSVDAVENKRFTRPTGAFTSIVEEDGTTTTEPFSPAKRWSQGRGDARARLSFKPAGGKQGTPRELGREGHPDVVKCLVLSGTQHAWKRTEPFVLEIAVFETAPDTETKK